MNRNFALIITISMLALGLAACVKGRSISIIDKIDDFQSSDQKYGSSAKHNKDKVEHNSLDREQADLIVQKFVNALNAEEPQDILECLDPEKMGYYTIETVETAISDFKAYFKNSPINQYRWLSDDSDIPNSYIYELIGESGDRLEIKVVYDEQEDISWISCEFLDYSYQSKHLLEKLIYALESESKLLLAQILKLDNFDCSISDAAEIIEKYREHFDLESLEYKFVDLDSENQAFIYYIIGQKNGKAVEHPIKISYKDGIIRLNDPWIPYNADSE